MMGVYIKGMEMPGSCAECPLLSNCDECEGHHNRCMPLGVVNGYSDYFGSDSTPSDERRDDCPLVPLPPHGRVIDADALEDNNITYYAIPVLKNVTDATIREAELVIRLKDLDAAPTIIPAEEEKNGMSR